MSLMDLLASRASRMKASEIRELLKLLDQPDIISFAGGIPDPALFPSRAIADAYASVLGSADAGAALQYQVSEGFLPLRRWLAGQMGKLGIFLQRSGAIEPHQFLRRGGKSLLAIRLDPRIGRGLELYRTGDDIGGWLRRIRPRLRKCLGQYLRHALNTRFPSALDLFVVIRRTGEFFR